jgi:hypothetical protein
MSDIERRVRERAYQLWEAAGYPQDRSDEFWYYARQEIESDIPPVGDAPGGAIDFPPDERSVEDPPELSVDTGMPFEVAAGATVPHEPAPAEPPPAARPTRSAATTVARKAAEVGEEAASTGRGRAPARPAGARPTPPRPGRK